MAFQPSRTRTLSGGSPFRYIHPAYEPTPREQHSRLKQRLKVSVRAMLWAIYEKCPAKASRSARAAARAARQLMALEEQR